MPYYGDISGSFRGLLNGDCETCVVAIVAGSSIDCQRCPKRSVRRVQDLSEARWNELKYVEKRRFFDCLNDERDAFRLGYGSFTQDQLHSIKNYHRLYQGDAPSGWDILLKAFAYTEVLMELATDAKEVVFYPDQFASTPQQEQLETAIEDRLEYVSATTASSKRKTGIQTADCLAGGIREQLDGGEPWLDYLDMMPEAEDQRYWALSSFENLLNR